MARKLTKNEKRRARKKAEAAARRALAEEPAAAAQPPSSAADPAVEVEYTTAAPELEADAAFAAVLARFAAGPEAAEGPVATAEGEGGAEGAEGAAAEAAEEEEQTVSRRKRKLASRLSVAELKQLVERPDVIEVHDVTSADPRLLVYLKSYRNSVAVPRHWSAKRKYLQGKRGVEKAPWQLPEFIAQTGIEKIRSAIIEKDEKSKAKSKSRERVAPKMGKIDIDYQVLHDAFFRFQTKPPLTLHGDLYHEGREFEVNLRSRRPGVLSAELKEALGIVEGGPPPWLINMQRYGPPPSYPNLKIPGLTSPIPEGAQYGYHPGGWGKPPVDQFGRPLYGDVFGTAAAAASAAMDGATDKEHWGGVADPEDEESEEESEEGSDEEEGEDDMEEEAADASGMETPMTDDGLSSVSTSGLETPDTIDLRKGIRSTGGFDTPSESGSVGLQGSESQQKELYKILEQKDTVVGSDLYGASHKYVVPSGGGAGVNAPSSRKGGAGVQVALDPDQVDGMDQEQLALAYQEEVEAASAARASNREDFSDLIAEQERKRLKAKKRKEKKKAEAASGFKF